MNDVPPDRPVDPNAVPASKPDRGYHHGALRPALIAAARALVIERGPDGFSLRETARRAQVSPSAPAHHFGGMKGLLTAVAAEGIVLLAEQLEAVPDEDFSARITAQANAYVQFAHEQRALFDLMWRRGAIDTADPAHAAAVTRILTAFDRTIRGAEAPAASGPQDPLLAPTHAAWSMIHGFAALAAAGAYGNEPWSAERARAALLSKVLSRLVL
ncbi:TetR/AcrR family transcriptional regulator [Allosphingosinicella indica]|uniref:Transcriptional regulator, TetR family n=1 Tax=Allosphingosinicella indica TaxID=941907 RepID=A0A1X7GU74_9SPHN|nr:TetR/AcrR family transcriptional regulator [Allosphingosinicella indica]SMF74806.1 transcriptional regulator, TetR family [Allosphingosinicella indica]